MRLSLKPIKAMQIKCVHFPFAIFLALNMLFVLSIASAADILPIDIKMDLKKVSKHIYYVEGLPGLPTENKGFISNSVAIITDEGIIILDALGTPSLAKKFIRKIREVSNKPIKKIFISHYHADHFYGLQGLIEPGVEIYAPAGAQNYLAREAAMVRLETRRNELKPWLDQTKELIPANHYLTKNMDLKFGGLDIAVLLFGSAHSDGDLVLYVKQDKVLITGDLLFTGRIPFIGGDNIKNWITQIDELANYPANWTIPGHGAAFKEFSKGSQLTKNYLSLMYSSMHTGVEDLIEFDEIYKTIDWREFENLPAFKTGNRINAYRVFLSEEKASLNTQ